MTYPTRCSDQGLVVLGLGDDLVVRLELLLLRVSCFDHAIQGYLHVLNALGAHVGRVAILGIHCAVKELSLSLRYDIIVLAVLGML